jgi:DNA repair photolyase
MRKLVSKAIPRKTVLLQVETAGKALVKEKGRKRNYSEFNLYEGRWEKNERLLDKENINSFVEISLRAPECPMCLNVDVWDGLACPYKCRYCFANYFRASLYTSFFDNAREIGLRHADPDTVWAQIEKSMSGKGDQALARAFALRMPVRFGIRFEDFLPIEAQKKISLNLLQRLQAAEYPVMINTKSDILARNEYIKALAENPAGSAVHITLLSSNPSISKFLDVNSPPSQARFDTAKRLTQAGIRVVLRIEPFGVFMNDNRGDTDRYIEMALDAGVSHMTFDTYSYSAGGTGTARAFESGGADFSRMFLSTSESQWLGSLMLNRFMDHFRAAGISCSTFDFGSIPDNDNWICCEVDDAFRDAGFNWGNILSAARVIQGQNEPVSWGDFEAVVKEWGGWLSDELHERVHRYWNMDEDSPYNLSWVRGIRECGTDAEGNLIWKYDESYDFREELFNGIFG